MKRTRWCVGVAAMLVSAAALGQTGAFTPVGIGGGGGMYTPMGSPSDPDFWLMTCDMSGAYRTLDGGKSFEMLNWADMRSCHTCRPAFAGNDVYWARGCRDLRVSRDKAKTWEDVTVGTNAPWSGDSISHLAAIEGTPRALFAGTGKGVYASADGGKTWRQAKPEGAEGFGCTALCTVGNDVFAGLGGALYRSADGGKTWNAAGVGAPDKPALAVSGAAGKDGGSLICVVLAKSGVTCSDDGGKTWRTADEPRGQNDVLVPAGQTAIAYAANNKEVFRTLDSGKTWTSCFHMGKNVKPSFVQTELSWGYGIMHFGLGVSHADPKTAMVATQGDFYVTRDGGESWDQQMGTPVTVAGEGLGFRSKGLEVTTTWRYYIDPFETNRHYIAYTDIGFSRSVDGGTTWLSSVKGCPWGNTFYELAFDPFEKGRIYAATSSRHDIPHWTHTDANRGQPGGVCVSPDFGRTWTPLGKGLPALPCTSICIDPKSTPEKLTLYCTLYEGGVYKSVDGGQQWRKMSEGLGNAGNLHALLVRVHPKTGSLFCSITAMRVGGREFPVTGGLWKSMDGGESWRDISKDLKLHWANGYAVDPNDANVIYLTAATIPGGPEGGIYKTIDGGKSWTRLLKDADFQVSFAPKDPKAMWVTTFGGGVWKGYYLPAN